MRAPAIVAIVLALGACSSDDGARAGADPARDVATEPPAGASGPMVFLRAVAGAEERVAFDVVARGLDRPVHGAAFRLRWDPARLGFVGARASDAWSAKAMALAKEGAPGELVVVWTEVGGAAGVAVRREEVLGTIELRRKAAGDAAVGFRKERSTLRDSAGTPLAVDWR